MKKESGKRNLHGHFAKSLGRDDEPIKNQATKQQIFVRFPAFPGKGPEKLNFPGRENPWSYFWILTGFGYTYFYQRVGDELVTLSLTSKKRDRIVLSELKSYKIGSDSPQLNYHGSYSQKSSCKQDF